MKKWISAMLCLALCFFPMASGWAEKETETEPYTLLMDLLAAVETPTDEAMAKIEADLAGTRDPVLTAAGEEWKATFLNPDYRMYRAGKDDPAALEIPDPAKHAFVVLGFQLKNGEMQPELVGRCDAAAAAAKAFPEARIVCTGGETGSNNPAHHTEAGLMGAYLAEKCGIGAERILLDPAAMTTADNTANTLEILRKNGIETMTLVTSGYHMRWAENLFAAAAAQYRQWYGYSVRLIGNWCYDTPPSPGYDDTNAPIAAMQLMILLNTPKPTAE